MTREREAFIPTRRSLIARLKNWQDQESWQTFFDTYWKLIYSVAIKSGLSEADAQDIVQDTFLQAIRSVHRFQGRSTVYTWLHAILLNLTRHYHRDRKRIVYDDESTSLEVSLPDDKLSELDAATASSALLEVLHKLTCPHREVVVLRYYDSMRIHEIARHLGISKGTVKSRLHYAIGEMQKRLPDELNLFGTCGTEEVRQR